MATREKPPPMGNSQWWQIVIGFSPPGKDIDYAREQLRIESPHDMRDPAEIRDYYARLYERNPSYLRALVNTVNPKTQGCVFPKLSKAMQARIVAGTKPVDFFNGELNKAEAHEALTLGYVMALPYLMRNVYRVLGGSNVRDCTVARWLDAVCKDPERLALLTREREPPRGRAERPWMVRDSYARHIDDLRAEDIVNGVKTGVRAAFERSERRRQEVLEREEARAAQEHVSPGGRPVKDQVALIPEWWMPIEGIEILTSRAELEAEGREMHHCVATYTGYVMSGECSILRIRVGRAKSTAEVRYQMQTMTRFPDSRKRITVIQHKGPCNATPAAACSTKLYKAIEFWHKALDERAKVAAESAKVAAESANVAAESAAEVAVPQPSEAP